MRINVALSPDRRNLRVAASDMRDLRRSLSGANVRFRQRSDQGDLLVDLWSGPALLDSELNLNWDDHALRAASRRRSILSEVSDVRDRVAAVRDGRAGPVRELIHDCSLVDVLDDHQCLNVAILTVAGSWGGCVFDEQGTGKTVSLIATYDLLVERGLTDTLLVVAPKSMVAEWQQEFRRFTGDLYRVAVAEGTPQEKAVALYSGADVIVVNYETLVSFEDEIVRLAQRSRLALAVDESFNVKNSDARRTMSAMAVREWCTHAFVLCGTPAPNRADDIVAQFDLTDLGLTFRGLQVDKDREVAAGQVRARLGRDGIYVRNLKQAVLADLPGRSFTEVPVELALQQRTAYDAALNNLVADLRSIDDREFSREITSYLERRSTLLRICADPSPIIEGYSETPAKVDALDGLLQDLVGARDEKVVVWSFYRSSLDRIAKRYDHYGLVRIDGSVTDVAVRREAVRSFQNDPEVKVFLGNPAAAGAGLTLHSARYAVYESLSNQAAHYLQSLDRIHRRGQDREVRYVSLVASGTLEEAEYARLRGKAAAQADLLGDPASDVPTRRTMLAELLGETRGDAVSAVGTA